VEETRERNAWDTSASCRQREELSGENGESRRGSGKAGEVLGLLDKGEAPGSVFGDQPEPQRHSVTRGDRQRRVHGGAQRTDGVVRSDGAGMLFRDLGRAAGKACAMHMHGLGRASQRDKEQAKQRNPLRAPVHAREGRAAGARTGSEEGSHADDRGGGRQGQSYSIGRTMVAESSPGGAAEREGPRPPSIVL
jgi:hypothetical protein